MAGRPRSIDDSKVFDVAKPNKSKPMDTSRPVIVSHTSPFKDPTVISVMGSEEANAKLAAPSVSRKIISPLTTEDNAVPVEESNITVLHEPTESLPTAPIVMKSKELVLAPDQEVTTAANVTATENEPVVPGPVESTVTNSSKEVNNLEVTEQPSEDIQSEVLPSTTENEQPEETNTDNSKTVEPEVELEKADESLTPEVSTGTPVVSDAASVDALAEASTKPKEEAKKAEDEVKKAVALQEMIDSKKYFVPLAHDSSQKKNGSNVILILLLLIILAGGVYAAIDARVVDTGISVPYHFFKQ